MSANCNALHNNVGFFFHFIYNFHIRLYISYQKILHHQQSSCFQFFLTNVCVHGKFLVFSLSYLRDQVAFYTISTFVKHICSSLQHNVLQCFHLIKHQRYEWKGFSSGLIYSTQQNVHVHVLPPGSLVANKGPPEMFILACPLHCLPCRYITLVPNV